MSDYSFLRTREEMAYFLSREQAASWMYDCEGIFAAWLTRPEILQKLLPPPLEFANPVVSVYIVNAFDPTFSTSYREAALIVPALYRGEPGLYTLGMLLEGTDNGVLLGREIMDLPKKNADSITVKRLGDSAYANVKRGGVCLMELKVELGGYNNPELGGQVFSGRDPGQVADMRQFCFRCDINKREGEGTFVTDMRLNDVHCQSKTKTWEPGEVRIRLRSTVNDPWAEIEVVEPIGAGWSRLDIGLLGSTLHSLGDGGEALPYLLGRYDAHIWGKPTRRL